MVRKALEKTGKARRTVLIPDSAHGTNPASAHFAGYTVKELKSNPRGTIDLDVLEQAMTDDVAALMLTVPNTLGIFEDRILDIARIVHAKGGYLYCDGANFNAFVGRRQARPHGRRRHAHEPAQDLLDAARRGRPGLGAGRGDARRSCPSCRGRPSSAAPTARSSSTSTGPSRSAGCGRSSATSACSCARSPTSRAYGNRIGEVREGRGPERQLHPRRADRRLSPEVRRPLDARGRLLGQEADRVRRLERGHRQAPDGLRFPSARRCRSR